MENIIEKILGGFVLAVFAILFILAISGCTVTIHNTGANARFELSPARDVAQNATFDVCNGLSAAAIPTSWGSDKKNADSADAKTEAPAETETVK